MNYHVLMDIGDTGHWWTNLSYDSLIQNIVIPYINKQVLPVSFESGKAILNLSTVSYMRVYKTSELLPENDEEFDVFEYFTSTEHAATECTKEIIDEFLVTKSPVESKSVLQTLFMPTKQQVFVIMKFGDRLLDSAYTGAIKPIVKKFKFKPLRIDEVQDSGRITNQILEEIAQSSIVLADLTGERPNCYYEAGFAHAIGKEMIFTIHKGSSVHFDLAGYRFIEWETEEDLRRELHNRFKAYKQRSGQK